MVLFLFASTLFLSAALLFSVQPMVAKMALPLVGGSPAVWTTCMLFFQAALLGVTTHLSIDVVSIPLLWVIPLAL
jgi:hypothetical protein